MSNPVVGGARKVWSRLKPDSSSTSSPSAQPQAKQQAGQQVKPLTAEQQRRRELKAKSLTELAEHFGTDKHGSHFYTQHYERHFAHLRTDKITLLEIGIGGYARQKHGGASLKMWKFFFPNAQIVGLDIEDKSFVRAPRIDTYEGSQVDEAVLRRIVDEKGPLQIVIDDGSHRPEHIRETFRLLFPMLEGGGLYAIEDTQTSYWPEWGGSEDLHDPTTTMALVKDLLDGLNYEEYVDLAYEPTYADLHVVAVHCYHNLVIIEKGSNTEGSNKRMVLSKRYRDAPAP